MEGERELLNTILAMSNIEQQKYFESLNASQFEFVRGLLNDAARPKEKCDLFDSNASFSDWITSHFYVPELNGPMWLAPYQIDALNEATKIQDDGLFAYSLVVWSDIKKSIKSSIAAAVALRFAFMRDWTSVKVVANGLDQAQSRSYYYLTRCIKLNPQMQKMLDDGRISINKTKVEFAFNNSAIQAIPCAPDTQAGGDDSCIVWTEAWAAKNEAAKTLWTEMVIPPARFGKGFKWVESYAGHVGESPILEPLYQNNVKPEYSIGDKMYSNRRTFTLWNDEPKLPWQTQEYYAQQSVELLPSEFLRVHRNQWTDSQSTFVPYDWWADCFEELPELTQNENMVLGVDAAISGDSFAIVGVTKHPKDKERLAVRLVKIWKPEKGKSIVFSHPDEKQNSTLPDGYITNLCKKYKVKIIVYDPYQLYNLATQHNLSRKSAYWDTFNQGAQRLEADANLYHLIRENKIAHPNFSELNEHIKNANVQSDGDSKMRIVKRTEQQKIDSVVALSMASFIAKRLNL